MERVTVAQLKAKLSEYLRRVEAGESFMVVKHDHPVAVLQPVATRPTGLSVRHADPALPAFGEGDLGEPVDLGGIDIVDVLREERADRF
jgi:prevent-host-death family protein